jgi:hypothetical protein
MSLVKCGSKLSKKLEFLFKIELDLIAFMIFIMRNDGEADSEGYSPLPVR